MQGRARGRCIAGHWDFCRPNGKGDSGSFDIHFGQCFRMHFTEHPQHFLGAQANAAMTTRMPPICPIAQNLNLGGCTQCGQYCLDICLGIKQIDTATGSMKILWTCAPNQKARNLQVLFLWFATMECGANFEQSHIRKPTRLIALCCLQ